MNLDIFLEHMSRRDRISSGSEMFTFMVGLSQEALRICAELNGAYHGPEEIRALMARLIGKPVDESFAMFPPFYTDFGKNIHLGKNVFINSGCRFQDQGGIRIGDGAFIGHGVILATLNHDLNPEKRSDTLPAPIVIGKKVWIGAGATIIPGVTIGDNSVIAAGAVVLRDVPANVIAGGVPAKVIREIKAEG